MKRTRRQFLQTTAAATVAASAPYLWTRRTSRAGDANARPRCLAIGVGGSRGAFNRGGTIARQASKFADIVAVCDVDERHAREFAEKMGGKPKTYFDYREALAKEKPDIVTIGTPDHWHVPIAIAAMRAGCDVYCEKPLTLTIDEGKQICRVAKETQRVFQVGTQQRREYGHAFLKAIALVQGGYLGTDIKAHVAIGGAPVGGPFETTAPPEDLHWDFWVGPAPAVDYVNERRHDFRWFLEYSGGKMTDWGAHHIDIAQWALGCDHTGPVEVSGSGKFPPIVPENFDFARFFAGEIRLPHAFNAPPEFHLELRFANGGLLTVHHHYRSEDGETDFGNGILFEGSEGRIFVNRGRLSGKPVEELTEDDKKKLDEAVAKLYRGKPMHGHMANFFDCLEDRSLPIADVFTHHRTMTSCHLCNIALMLGRPLRWNPDQETFVGDEQAVALMRRPSRADYLSQ